MYDLDFVEEGKLKLHIRKFLLYPDYWADNSNKVDFNVQCSVCEFTPSNRDNIPKERGVYCFVVIPSYKHIFETKYLFYAGKTNRTLWDRYKEYLDDQEGRGKPRKKVFEMLKLYKGYLYFFYAPLSSSDNVDLFEEKLLNTFVPHINTKIPDAKIKSELMYIYE